LCVHLQKIKTIERSKIIFLAKLIPTPVFYYTSSNTNVSILKNGKYNVKDRRSGSHLKYWWKKADAESHIQLPAFRAQSASNSSSSNTCNTTARLRTAKDLVG
jgi:hypothetical protein